MGSGPLFEGYTMLTYQVTTSMALPAKGSLIFGLTWRWPYQNPEKLKKPNGNLLDLVV